MQLADLTGYAPTSGQPSSQYCPALHSFLPAANTNRPSHRSSLLAGTPCSLASVLGSSNLIWAEQCVSPESIDDASLVPRVHDGPARPKRVDESPSREANLQTALSMASTFPYAQAHAASLPSQAVLLSPAIAAIPTSAQPALSAR